MNKLKILPVLMLVVILIPTTHAMAHDQGNANPDAYNMGWNDGGFQAQTDWNSHLYDESSGGQTQCPDGHSHSYCQGWNAGYANEWNRAIVNNQNVQQTQELGQGSDINVKGNNNKIQVNQGQAAVGGDSGSGSGSDGSGGSGNPRCLALCSVVH